MLGPEAFGLVDDDVSEVSSQSNRKQATQKVPEALCYAKPPQKKESSTKEKQNKKIVGGIARQRSAPRKHFEKQNK